MSTFPGAPERPERLPTHDDIARWRMTRYERLRPKPTPYLDALGENVLDEVLAGLANIQNRELISEFLARQQSDTRDGTT